MYSKLRTLCVSDSDAVYMTGALWETHEDMLWKTVWLSGLRRQTQVRVEQFVCFQTPKLPTLLRNNMYTTPPFSTF